MAAHNRKLTEITFDLGGTEFQVQCRKWEIVNDTEDGETFYTFAPDGAFVELPDGDFSLDLEFYADWRSAGISDFLWDNDGDTVAFTLVHHPNTVGEAVQWAGQVAIKAPNVGGDIRTTEVTATKLKCVEKPVYSRV